MKERLKPITNWTLEFLGNVALNVAAKCANLRDGAITEKSEAKDNQVHRPPTEVVQPKQKEVVAQTSPDIETINYVDISDIPSNLYLSEYFTMPSSFRVYAALVEVYRHELLVEIRELQGCNDFMADIILKSMEYYLTQLKAGNKACFEGQTDWLFHYAKMCGVISIQNQETLVCRAAMCSKFIETLEDDYALKEKGELLVVIKDTGKLPSSMSLAILDLLAFINMPLYFRKRVASININLNSSMKVRGEFDIN